MATISGESVVFEEEKNNFKDGITRAKSLGTDDESIRAYASKYRFSEYEHAMKLFVQMKGILVICPNSPFFDDGMFAHFHVSKDDYIVPMCHEGQNRSQIMWHMLRGMDLSVAPPHGVLGGFDPYKGYDGLTADNYYEYLHNHLFPLNEAVSKGDFLAGAFYKAFGVEKSSRFGEEFCVENGFKLNPEEDLEDIKLVEEHRKAQRKHMDETLFNADYLLSKTGKDGRVVIVAFCIAPLIFIQRLIEVSGKRDYSKFVVICLPYTDPFTKCKPRSSFPDTDSHFSHLVDSHIDAKNVYSLLFSVVPPSS